MSPEWWIMIAFITGFIVGVAANTVTVDMVRDNVDVHHHHYSEQSDRGEEQ